MKDKTGTVLRAGDFVLIAHNGPYLNFGQVQGVFVDSSEQEYMLVLEVYQYDNDPSQDFDTRPQTIKSSHRVVKLQPEQVPATLVGLLTPVREAQDGK